MEKLTARYFKLKGIGTCQSRYPCHQFSDSFGKLSIKVDWDPEKDLANQIKHDISFSEAQYAFTDPNRVIAEDLTHSNKKRKTVFLLWKGWRWRHDGEVYLSSWCDSNIWRRLLAER